MKTPELSPYELAFRAESGDAGAQFQLGMLFLLGEGVDQDLAAAHRWMRRAAEANHPGAQILARRLAAVEHQEISERSGLNGSRRQIGWRALPVWAQHTCAWLGGKVRLAVHLPRRLRSNASRQRAGVDRIAPTQKSASFVDAA